MAEPGICLPSAHWQRIYEAVRKLGTGAKPVEGSPTHHERSGDFFSHDRLKFCGNAQRFDLLDL